MRTTLDLDPSVLRQLKQYQRESGGTLGAAASELLAQALVSASPNQAPPPLQWVSHPMGARVDFEDHGAVERLTGVDYDGTSA